MIVGLLATLFLIVTAYITLARFDKLTAASFKRSQTAEDVLDNVNTFVLSRMRQAWADANGNLLAGGREDPDNLSGTGPGSVLDSYMQPAVPGYRGSRWLAGSEAVRDCNLPAPADRFEQLRLYRQTVSSFAAADVPAQNMPLAGWGMGATGWPIPGGQPRVPGLILEDPNDGDNYALSGDDLVRFVRNPTMDADGSGMPDTNLTAMAPTIELANAVADVPVHVPVRLDPLTSNTLYFDSSAIGDPDNDIFAAQYQRYADQVRYEPAVKVISNGGFVPLTSPGRYINPGDVWNRQFVVGMFNWCRYLGSPADLQMDESTDNALLNGLWAAADEVEPLLRYRGGLLANYTDERLGSVPEVLTDLRDRFHRTFRVYYDDKLNTKLDDSQRFNLASARTDWTGPYEWDAYRAGGTLDPDAYNYALGQPTANPLQYYVQRRLFTTISNSDDLARDVTPEYPKPALLPPTIPGRDPDMGIYPGQLKFYLGDLEKAFAVDGRYIVNDHVQVGSVAVPVGSKIVRRLANYYYEMLADYRGWDGQANATEAVTRREQAFMLAVNTLAFIAPRVQNPDNGTPGFIDAVWYIDYFDGSGIARTYVGTAPQPFFSEAVLYCDDGADLALGLELFNPYDSLPSGGNPGNDKFCKVQTDPYALDLSQFVFRVTFNDDPTVILQRSLNQIELRTGGWAERLVGRNFLSVSLDTGTNTDLRDNCDGLLSLQPAEEVDPPTGTARIVKLWLYRKGSDHNLYLVDSMVLGDPGSDVILPQFNSDRWVVDVYRDSMSYEPAFAWDTDGAVGALPTATDRPARWGMATNLRRGDQEEDVSVPGQPGTQSFSISGYANNLGIPDAGGGSSQHFAPSAPLYTMNADLGGYYQNDYIVHGARRPKSLPTVGFLLFVPRFATVSPASDGNVKCMSDVLAEQWEIGDSIKRPLYKLESSLDNEGYPADFGHMWIFDNNQEVSSNSLFDDERAGQLPWGLLVFDYFTTVSPYEDVDNDGRADIDPLRIAGRININTAPWYVLAGLPVLNPDSALGLTVNIDGSASPAFWSAESGVLVGNVMLPNTAATIARFVDTTNPTPLYRDTSANWLRLGPYLAQAAASYRDRVRYVSPAYTAAAYVGAEQRSGFRPFAIYGEMRNSHTAGGKTLSHRGFLSLGELANVVGFDLRDPLGGTGYKPLTTKLIINGQWQARPDFFKAVSLIALLDTHFLTTSSNTFTVYASVMDKLNPQASIREQLTVDRSNMLPRLVLYDADGDGIKETPLLQDTDGDLAHIPDAPVLIESDALPEIVTQRRIGYFNTKFDQ
jgi:hypothetical protein